jgi:NAD(P)-dependent dehydrogenase (short-subunit alcohol dehydrogenase family)
MLARSMARELAPRGILVNVVAPGIVDAGIARHQRETDPRYAERIGKVIPLGRLQQAEEVAHAVSFLLSAGGDYVTGTTLLVDGGCSLFQFD